MSGDGRVYTGAELGFLVAEAEQRGAERLARSIREDESHYVIPRRGLTERIAEVLHADLLQRYAVCDHLPQVPECASLAAAVVRELAAIEEA